MPTIETEVQEEPKACDLVELDVGLDLDRTVRDAIHALAQTDGIYQRGGRLARVVPREPRTRTAALASPDLPPTVRLHTEATLRRVLSTAVRFRRPVPAAPGQFEACEAPRSVIANLLQDGTLRGIPSLVGVATSPVVRPDGTLAQDFGYDAASGFFLALPEDWPRVPEQPTFDDAVKATAFLRTVMSDFPWATPADVAAWLALGLALVCRPAIRGPIPLFVVTANTRGAGKSRLVDVMSLIVTGHGATRATQPSDDAECGKLLTSIALEGEPLLLLDNLAKPLGGPKLDAWLTGDRWKDRLLGANVTTDLPITTVLAATGNNVCFQGDTPRRVLPIRLDTPLECPEARRDFAIPDLLGYVRSQRFPLLAALLTIARAWFAAGRPGADEARWGGFEAFTAVVPPMLRWVGEADPLLTRLGIEEADATRDAVAVLLRGWAAIEEETGTTGLTVRDVVARVYAEDQTVRPGHEATADALEELAPGRGGERLDAKRIGYVLRRWKGRMVAGQRWQALAATARGGAKWTVR